MASLTREMDSAYVKALLKKKQEKPATKPRALVVVVGDIGHSPRMQFHVASFAKEGFDVDFVGFRHSDPRADILQNAAVEIHPILDFPSVKLPRLLVLPLKVLWLIFSIFFVFKSLKKPDIILIQNPPTFPIVFCAWIWNFFWQAALIMDFHNYSYSIMAINTKSRGRIWQTLIRVMEWIEHRASQFSDANICVSKAMAEDIQRKWNSKSTVLYDRPPSDFAQVQNMEARHFLFSKLAEKSNAFRSQEQSIGSRETAFTRKELGQPAVLKEDRSALIVSSTSWTEDEDFGIFFEALKLYDSRVSEAGGDLPKLVAVVTGKGPLKQFYMEQVKKENLKNVQVVSLWLETADYPRLLGMSDLGVCLHYSSSGMDLPMKVVDMFGCGLPVCAVKYNCIEELVKPNENGLLFETATQLNDLLCNLFTGFPSAPSDKLTSLRRGAATFIKHTWHDNWTTVFLPLVRQTIDVRKKSYVDPKKRALRSFMIVAIIGLFSAWVVGVFTNSV